MAEPSITLRAVHDSGTGNTPITRVVIHATCPDVGYSAASAPNAAHGTALYFQNPAAGGSAHYVCGVDGEEHCVPEDVIAWHAPPNPGSLGIEITAEGGDYPKNYTREQWLSDEVWPAVQRAAERCRDLCDRHGVPKVKLSPADLLAGKHGICGHVDVSQAWHQTDHTDPNNDTFPWDRFMAAVNGEEDDMTPDEHNTLMKTYQVVMRKVPGGVQDILDVSKHTLTTVTALQAAVTALAASKGADPAAIQQAVTDAVDKALADLKITLTTAGDPAGAPTPAS